MVKGTGADPRNETGSDFAERHWLEVLEFFAYPLDGDSPFELSGRKPLPILVKRVVPGRKKLSTVVTVVLCLADDRGFARR